jgi:hypothetical protein
MSMKTSLRIAVALLACLALSSGRAADEPQGNVAAGATDAGNPLKIGGKYNTTPPTLTSGQRGDLQLDSVGNVRVVLGGGGYPAGATPVHAASGNVANASAAATLAAAVGKTTYITGFEITGGGATAAALVLATVTGLSGGTATYIVGAVAGVTLQNQPLVVKFQIPIPASATNTAIVVTLPALGAGNTNAAVVAHGFQL